MTKLKILYVNDDGLDRLIFRNSFSKEFDIVEAIDGIDGINKYKERSPDIVIMDYRMPRMCGSEAFYNIREYDPNAKVIMISTLFPSDKEELESDGVIKCLEGYSLEELKDLVRNNSMIN